MYDLVKNFKRIKADKVKEKLKLTPTTADQVTIQIVEYSNRRKNQSYSKRRKNSIAAIISRI